MAKCVELTNVRIFAAECRRMPCFVLHEMAHAYHDQVLRFEDSDIIAAYQRARDRKSYDAVERFNGERRVLWSDLKDCDAARCVMSSSAFSTSASFAVWFAAIFCLAAM